MSETIVNNETWCVYMHVNLINNKVYVGQTCKKPPELRWGRGSGYREDVQPVFYRAIQKYGWDNFDHRIIADNLTKEEASQLEIELIAQYKSNCHRYNNPSYGYNMTDGGEGHYGHEHSDEARKKMRQHAKQRFSIPENTPMFGRTHTEESRKRIGDGHRDPSAETRQKMSESAIARCTDEWRRKKSEQYKGKFVGNKNPNAKYVYQYSSNWDLIKIWETVKDVSVEFEVSKSTVSGTWLKNSERLYRGFHWSLINIETPQNDYEVIE